MNKIAKRALFLGVPITITCVTGGYFLFNFLSTLQNSNNAKEEVDDVIPTTVYDNFEIFPNLNKYSFYEFIRINKGIAVINDVMISQIINHIINNMQIPEGDISFNYFQEVEQSLHLTFSVEIAGKKYVKSYYFEIE